MRIAVLGGTAFLSRATARAAVARGHEVAAVCRGRSGAVPPGVRHVRWDRAVEPVPVAAIDTALGGPPEVVVDVGRTPSWVRDAVAALPGAHWVFVSTISVYPDEYPVGASPATVSPQPARDEDVDLREDPTAYGPTKVACEEHVRAGAALATIVRPGLIAGPEDPSGRFTYWPERLADGGEVLLGGRPEDAVQVIDVRDLADWLVLLAEEGTTGTVDAVGPATPFGDLVTTVAAGVGAAIWQPSWVPDAALAALDVAPWMGPRSLPLWLPRPEHDAMMRHDPAPSEATGLRWRPIADTARDTLTWSRAAGPAAVRTGLTRDEERAVLAAWHARDAAGTEGDRQD
ncbi:NAD-dependent epimerase/dehydratase family protein [Nocardioides sp.]|uniref:NAD-dependent epimerase/dehydratase family protein n=1 Tax=Nocardioides sp. TaxID=35761 RepID=UPI0035190678